MIKKGNKRAQELLTENFIFITLNLIYFSVLIAFLAIMMTNTPGLEELYAKKIALSIDAAQPGMKFALDMTEAFDKAQKNKYTGDIIFIDGNVVTVKLGDSKGYSYSFFNDVSVPKPYALADKGGFMQFFVEKKNG